MSINNLIFLLLLFCNIAVCEIDNYNIRILSFAHPFLDGFTNEELYLFIIVTFTIVLALVIISISLSCILCCCYNKICCFRRETIHVSDDYDYY